MEYAVFSKGSEWVLNEDSPSEYYERGKREIEMVLVPHLHRGRVVVLVLFPYDKRVVMEFSKSRFFKWSHKNKAWYFDQRIDESLWFGILDRLRGLGYRIKLKALHPSLGHLLVEGGDGSKLGEDTGLLGLASQESRNLATEEKKNTGSEGKRSFDKEGNKGFDKEGNKGFEIEGNKRIASDGKRNLNLEGGNKLGGQLEETGRKIQRQEGWVKQHNQEGLIPSIVYRGRGITLGDIGVHENNSASLRRFIQELILRLYSVSTVITYRSEFIVFLKLLGKHDVTRLSVDDIRRYIEKCILMGLSDAAVHSRINALKFFYEKVMKRDKFFVDIPRPKKGFQLPKAFSQEEVVRIIRMTRNMKHRFMIMMAYGAGLRVSELVHLRVEDIDEMRRVIYVRHGKGRKDRVVVLSPVLLVMMRQYKEAYQIGRSGYLFEGQTAGVPYTSRSLQMVIQRSKELAGVVREGSVHALRHSFATHLLDRGTDVTMIQKLLGHNDIRTTLRYLHITNRDLLNVFSPIDGLNFNL